MLFAVSDDNHKALENLNKAIESNPDKMRQNAIDDEEWDVIRDSYEFKKLIDE